MMLDADAQRVTAWRDPDSALWVKLRRADQHIVCRRQSRRAAITTAGEPEFLDEDKPASSLGV
jgi:hypothetical protein